jgi:hypothetical protein
VVIDDFDLVRIALAKLETDAPAVVHRAALWIALRSSQMIVRNTFDGLKRLAWLFEKIEANAMT